MFKLLAILALILSLSSLAVAGPIFPTRSFILAPAFRDLKDTSKSAEFLKQQGVWGNLVHAFQSANDRFGWSISSGAIIQFVEWPHSQIYLVGDFEVLADTHNDISFNPRAIFWTEGVVYSDKIDATELSVGYIHRCHHDIDNLGYNVASSHEGRSLIYGSAMARVFWRDITVGSSPEALRFSPFVQLDHYLITQDERIPNQSERGTDVAKLNASLSIGCRFGFDLSSSFGLYSRFGITEAFYDHYRFSSADVRAEIGVEVAGIGTRMNIFVGGEHLSDDYNSVMPINSQYIFLGFRFIGKNVGL